MSADISEFIEAIGTRLEFVGKSFFGRVHLARQDAPPRYVWCLDDEGGDLFEKLQAQGGANPRPLASLLWGLEVHCWGKTFNETKLMRQALVTAIRAELGGENYSLGRGTWREPMDSRLGFVCVQRIGIRFLMIEAEIPTSAGEPVADNVIESVTIRRVGFDADVPPPAGTLQAEADI